MPAKLCQFEKSLRERKFLKCLIAYNCFFYVILVLVVAALVECVGQLVLHSLAERTFTNI